MNTPKENTDETSDEVTPKIELNKRTILDQWAISNPIANKVLGLYVAERCTNDNMTDSEVLLELVSDAEIKYPPTIKKPSDDEMEQYVCLTIMFDPEEFYKTGFYYEYLKMDDYGFLSRKRMLEIAYLLNNDPETVQQYIRVKQEKEITS